MTHSLLSIVIGMGALVDRDWFVELEGGSGR